MVSHDGARVPVAVENEHGLVRLRPVALEVRHGQAGLTVAKHRHDASTPALPSDNVRDDLHAVDEGGRVAAHQWRQVGDARWLAHVDALAAEHDLHRGHHAERTICGQHLRT